MLIKLFGELKIDILEELKQVEFIRNDKRRIFNNENISICNTITIRKSIDVEMYFIEIGRKIEIQIYRIKDNFQIIIHDMKDYYRTIEAFSL